MSSILHLLKDERIYETVEELLIRGYANYNIPEEIPIKIISALKESETLKSAIKKIYQIPEMKNRESIFWKGRKEYESDKIRHYEILHFIKSYLKGGVILEVGCGGGNLGLIIAKQYKIKKFFGTDIYLPKKMITTSKIEFKEQKTKTRIPIKDSFVDIILLIDVLHHISKNNQEKILMNIKKKLKNNGTIIFFEHTFSEIKEPLLNKGISQRFKRLSKNQKLACIALIDWIGNILILRRKISMPYSHKTLEEWEELFAGLGFKIMTSQYIGFPEKFFHQGPYSLLVLKK